MRNRRLLATTLVAVALLTAACGARLDDEQLAAAQSGGPTGVVPGNNASAGGSRTGGATSTTLAGTGADPGTGDGGATPQGDGAATPPGGQDPSQAAACTPQPVDEVGVSDTEVVIGSISTISGPIAGFGQTAMNAVKAYVAYVNASGGVCGRQLRLVTGDDRLDAGSNRSETQRLAEQVLGFAGGITVVDNGGAQVLNGTNIPDVTLAIGNDRKRLPNNFSPNPINPDEPGNQAGAIMQYFAAQGITSAAVIWPAQADARDSGQGYVEDLNSAGITNIDTYEVAITETNYVNVAQQIENKGTQLVITLLEVSGMARLAQAFQQVGYLPRVPYYGAQAYGEQFIELAGEAAEGTTIGITHATFEDPVPMMQSFLEWYGRVAPGSKPDYFAIMSWAAADMFVRALRAAGGAPTRDAVLEHLRTMTEYTGDGFMAPRDPVSKHMGNCFAIVKVEGGRWVRVDPTGGGFVNC